MSNDTDIRYSIVVPFFNEQENIPPLYMKLTEVDGLHRRALRTGICGRRQPRQHFRVLSDIYEHDRRVNLIRLRRNFGQTAALKAGFDFARGTVIISMDGDLQHDPEEIPRFLEKIEEGYDLVSGWRYARHDDWLMRQIPSRAANWMMAKLSGVELHDFGTTFKAYRREIIQRFSFTASCTGLFRRWPAPPAQKSWKCRSKTWNGKAVNRITALAAPFACFWT